MPGDGVTPGLIGSVNPRLPSIRDGEPPMPARTQKYVPPAHADLPRFDPAVGWARVALLVGALAVVLSIELLGHRGDCEEHRNSSQGERSRGLHGHAPCGILR